MKNKILIFLLFIGVFASAQDSIRLKLYRENVGTTYYIYADNDEVAPISLEYKYTAENMSSSLKDKSVIVIPPKSKKFLVSELKSIDKKKGTKFNYNVFYVLGDVNVSSAETDFTYLLPFDRNKKYRVYQGYNGKFSHANAFSIDFSLQIGDKVFASRAGKVAQVVTGNNKNCVTNDCAKFNNKILILHNDGTFAEYVHLKQNGSVVKLGDEVLQGQHIGYSGNTGWSQGPHLHFSVFVPTINGERKYIKTKFLTAENKEPVYLLQEKSYSRN